MQAKSVSILLALIIATTQLLFSCQSVMASLIPSPHRQAHSCCDHSTPTPLNPSCPHCSGTAAVMSALSIEPHTSHLPAMDLLALPATPIALLTLTDQPVDRSSADQSVISIPATTLLGQHCALQV